MNKNIVMLLLPSILTVSLAHATETVTIPGSACLASDSTQRVTRGTESIHNESSSAQIVYCPIVKTTTTASVFDRGVYIMEARVMSGTAVDRCWLSAYSPSGGPPVSRKTWNADRVYRSGWVGSRHVHEWDYDYSARLAPAGYTLTVACELPANYGHITGISVKMRNEF